MRSARRKYVLPLIPIILALSLFIAVSQYHNFHVVTDSVVYRSKQLNQQSFAFYINKFKIKSVLNLRGVRKSSGWYQDEIDVMKQYGVEHFDYRLSAIRDVDRVTLDNIMEIIRNAPKPILIHCEGGADRTGLVCAVWKYHEEQENPDVAVKQLSLLYGHIPYFGNRTIAMDNSFWNYIQSNNKNYLK
jgi:protein tyrosine/serine phosphatase